jgi:hypothetical protein
MHAHIHAQIHELIRAWTHNKKQGHGCTLMTLTYMGSGAVWARRHAVVRLHEPAQPHRHPLFRLHVYGPENSVGQSPMLPSSSPCMSTAFRCCAVCACVAFMGSRRVRGLQQASVRDGSLLRHLRASESLPLSVPGVLVSVRGHARATTTVLFCTHVPAQRR